MIGATISVLALSLAMQAAQAEPEPETAPAAEPASSLTILKDVRYAAPAGDDAGETWRAYLPPPEDLEADKREPFLRFIDPAENESGDPVFGDSGLAETRPGQIEGVVRTTPEGETCVFNGSVLPC